MQIQTHNIKHYYYWQKMDDEMELIYRVYFQTIDVLKC